MKKLVVLKLVGNCQQGVQITVEIGEERHRPDMSQRGELPANPVLLKLYENWRQRYRQLDGRTRIKSKDGFTNVSLKSIRKDCADAAAKVRENFNEWLKSESFRPIRESWLAALQPSDIVRLIIQADDQPLQRLPWSLWELMESFAQAEVAISASVYQAPQKLARSNSKVKILAILGSSENIDVESDRQLLEQQLGSDAEICFLVEPQCADINDQLWDQDWDILYFAGHSQTHGQTGVMHINATDSLTVADLTYGFKKAIARGLQMAIFNSCDGMGLADALASLHIPQLIVMREPVPDAIAQAFLKHFLLAFQGGMPLYQAVRQSRERLQGMEDRYPCASWLPVMVQNPAEVPPTWQELLGGQARVNLDDGGGRLPPISKWQMLRRGVIVSLVTTGLVMGMRFLGVLQGVELKAYDALMRSRPPEKLNFDERILIVEVTQSDLNASGGYPLSDQVVTNAIQKLADMRPRAIGLDIHRALPEGQGRSSLLEQFKQNPNLFAICTFGQTTGETEVDRGSPSEFLKDQRLKNQISFSNLLVDQEDNTVRRQQLSYNPTQSTTPSTCSTAYSLSLQLAYSYLEQEPEKSRAITKNKNEEWQSGTVIFKKLPDRFGGYHRLLENNVYHLLINYRSSALSQENSAAQRVTLKQVLAGIDKSLVNGKIILIGTTAPIAKDFSATPYGDLPGVWIHAHMVSQLLGAALDRRPLIRALPQQWDSVIVLGWSLVGGILAGCFRSWIKLGIVGLLLLVSLYCLCLFNLIQGIWLPYVPSLLSLLGTSGVVIIDRKRLTIC
jgi:CHASE2 domain-containing sensor protein